MSRRLLCRAAACAIALLATPAVASACPACGLAGVRDNWAAYGIMSVILSVLPLGMIAGVVVVLARRARKLDEDARPDGR